MKDRKQKLELTWIGKENRPRLEPRVLIEDPELSYHAPHRVTENDVFSNILIHGDNLLALKALEQEHAGKVKCIYIDPPYNTGSAFEHYDDGVEHSLWLSLIRERAALLRRLLRPDGVLFCSVDSNELFYLGALLDEIFGRQNRLEVMAWKKSYGGGAKSRFIVNQHEFVLVYAKDLSLTPLFFLPPDPEAIKKYYKLTDEKLSTRGPYRLQPLGTTSMDDRPNLRYAIIADDGTEIWPTKQWQWSKDRVEQARKNNEIVFTKTKRGYTVSYKQYLRDPGGEERRRKPKSIIEGAYTQHGTYESVALFGQKGKFSFPKPEALISELLECCTVRGDLVLDSFLGSGTTAAVAHKMGRRWIGVELGEHAVTHCAPRLKKVIDGADPGGVTGTVEWKGGGGFRFYRLAPSLLEKDKWGNWVVSRSYNAAMLAEAVCKLAGFTYAPSDTVFWQHGHSTERDFIYVTTQNLSGDQLRQIADEVGEERSLLVYCSAFRANTVEFANLTVKKIPAAVLNRCEWGKDDYSLNVQNLPMAEDLPPANGEKKPKRQKAVTDLPLFAGLGDDGGDA
ncbi:MAG: site-specific DNA-methyltransferase [Deferrisomatales bacterium]|nr:site-specific DNA-methyltransferase [Deferrisomatales bacterium]